MSRKFNAQHDCAQQLHLSPRQGCFWSATPSFHTFADGSSADYLDDPLYGHSRYRKLKDLNEGTFGIVLLAMDVRSKEQVSILQCTSPLKLTAVVLSRVLMPMRVC